MIDQVCHSENAELCKQILATMSLVSRPITLSELVTLVDVQDDIANDHEALSRIIATCGSFLSLRENKILFVHQSAQGFLLDMAPEIIFPRGKGAGHYDILYRSLCAMKKTIRRDIFNLKIPGYTAQLIARPKPNPLAPVEYACAYWLEHLQAGWSYIKDLPGFDLINQVDKFIKQNYLHWLEALSLLGCLSQGIVGMLTLEDLLKVSGSYLFPTISPKV